MIGLGVMSRNLSLNMAERVFSVGGYDKDQVLVQNLKNQRVSASRIQIVEELIYHQQHLRAVVQVAVGLAIPLPGHSASLAYMDGYRSPWLPAILIQAQRDYFGAYSYERVNSAGVFHTEWRED